MNRSSDRRDAVPLALLPVAVAVAIALVASSAPRKGQSLLGLAGHPAAVSLAVALLTFASAVLVARLVVTRRALDHRMAMLATPAGSFNPSPESVVRLFFRPQPIAPSDPRPAGRTRKALCAPQAQVSYRPSFTGKGKGRYEVDPRPIPKRRTRGE